MAGHAQEEDQHLQNTILHMEAALGAKFEVLFQKFFVTKVSNFVIFCNLVDILDVAPAASKVKIEIRGFLQMKRTIAITALEKLQTPPAVSIFIQG